MDDAATERWPTLGAVVREHVLATCERCGWNLHRAAAALGVAQKTLYNHLNRYEAGGFVVREGKLRRRAGLG